MAAEKNTKTLDAVDPDDVRALFSERSDELHAKVDATRDAYCGFIFPVNRSDLVTVARALDLDERAVRALHSAGTQFSSFSPGDRGGQLTNHIVGASLLALRGSSLDSGLETVTDDSFGDLVREHQGTVLEIAEARQAWFGRIYFPAAAFASAFGVFGGKVSPETIFRVAGSYGYAAKAGERATVRGDFGIGVWLTLLARA
ncbi:hypothetical protein ACWFNE_17870 [Cellulomonas sp. NPDC055163]